MPVQSVPKVRFCAEALVSGECDGNHYISCAGIRADVSRSEGWMFDAVERPLTAAGVLTPGFVNAIAVNMCVNASHNYTLVVVQVSCDDAILCCSYHDGSEGIAQHMDCEKRFDRPITSLRLFSDSRLSFGSQLYGFTNSEFFVPMARGAITVMERE